MPQTTTWYCGHCGFGPMSIRFEDHCSNCQRKRDGYATVETHYISYRRLNNEDLPSPSLAGLVSSSSALNYRNSTTHGRVAPASFCEDYQGTSGVRSYGESSPIMSRSPSISEVLVEGYGPVTHGNRGWYCCQCNDGPNGLSTNLKCPITKCQHTRCGYCIVQ